MDCKRKYYYKYIVLINEHHFSLKPQGYELGNIIHKVLEKLTQTNTLNQTNLNNEISTYQTQNPYLTLELEI